MCLAFLVNVHGSYFEPKAGVRNGFSVNYRVLAYALSDEAERFSKMSRIDFKPYNTTISHQLSV